MLPFSYLKKYSLSIFGISVFFLVPTLVYSADLFFESYPLNEFGKYRIDVKINTVQSEPFNSASADIIFNDSFINVTSISTKNSIFDIWIDEPKQLNQNTITFAGGLTGKGGFIFEGHLFSVYVDALQEGASTFSYENEEILAHDGVGTSYEVDTFYHVIQSKETSIQMFDTNEDGDVSLKELSVGLSADA